MVVSPGELTIPAQPSILFVAETSDEEGTLQSPLWKLFYSWLRQMGLDPAGCYFTSLLSRVSLADALTRDKSETFPGAKPVTTGRYLRKEFLPEIQRTYDYINKLQPNVIVGLGDLALFALTQEKSLKNARGRITPGHPIIHGRKVLPTYSPQQIMAEYSNRPILFADLQKAKREAMFPEIRRPQRFLHIAPTLEELEIFYADYIKDAESLSVDIETKSTMITCVGFAPGPDRALVIPFYDENQPDGNYWRTVREERLAWRFVARVLREHKSFGQNFQYDMHHLWRFLGIGAPGFCDDTMLLHHALHPELQKGLGFLGSIYTDELTWKFMHKVRSDDRSAKKGDME